VSLGLRFHPDPVLRETCAEVAEFDEGLAELAQAMAEAMYAAEGRGLAAPQVGVTQRVFVMDAGWKDRGARAPLVFVNPEIIESGETLASYAEACLSIPGQSRRVARPDVVLLRWQDVTGAVQEARMTGIEAVIVQHERDHLDGVLILDHPEAPE